MTRIGGYAPIRDYAAIGDGRTAALVARDGSIDWLCLPDVDSGSVFGRLLDAEGGGAFELQPDEPFDVERRYRERSNVLETTFRTNSGVVRVTDAMTVMGPELSPMRELVRRVEGRTGAVPMRWRVTPRFDFGRAETRISRRDGRPFASGGRDAFAVSAWGAGEASCDADSIHGRFVAEQGTSSLLDLAATHQEPCVLPCRADVERRLDGTDGFWRDWSQRTQYEGEWREHVLRSALVLKLCVFAASGAIVAAPTTSLPEAIGGHRNWDYRFTWLRDAAFALGALLRLGHRNEAESFFWWFMHASRLTQPRLQILYRVDGSTESAERELDWFEGYARSRPVRVGNAAADQVQLDVYGDVLDSALLFVSQGGELDSAAGKDIARIADHVCEIWRERDAGIWEVRGEPAHFVHSKAMCWVALDRACRLAKRGVIPDRTTRWRTEAETIRRYVKEQGFDHDRGTYVRTTDGRDVDASLLTLALFGYHDRDDRRLRSTIEAVRRELGAGALVYRYRVDDGLGAPEGAFLACSFWLVDALARIGAVDDAKALMAELVALSNDVGLYSEEVRESDRAFLGNFPQALVHLALVNAAVSIADAEAER